MTAAECDEWAEFASVEPFGSIRDNLHAGIIASLIINVLRGKNSRMVSPTDFLLVTSSERQRRSLSDGIKRLRVLAGTPQKVNK